MLPLRRLVVRTRLATLQLHTTAPRPAEKTVEKTIPAGEVPGADMYAKQDEETPEPRVSHSGTRTYVVSPKESATYDVPGGAYGSSDPYSTPPKTPAPQTSATASTSPGTPHPNTTKRVPHHPDGVGDSAAVRFRSAPGTMGARGGSDGGLDLMDPEGVKDTNELAERNPPPTEEGGRQGLDEAWKKRK